MNPADCLLRRPKCVAMVGLGPSANAFWLECAQWNGQIPWEEVWVVNRASSAFKHDIAFNMHDLDELVRAAPAEELRLMKADKPIIAPIRYERFPMTVAYPIREVLDALHGSDLLSSTPAYMAAYAFMIGVKDVYLYGMDFHYENVPQAEKGGQGMAWLLGIFTALKINYHIPNTSSLLAANDVVLVEHPSLGAQPIPMRPLYGYVMEGPGPRDPRVPEGAKIIKLKSPGSMDVDNTPRSMMPRGADIGDVPVGADGQPAALAEAAR